MTIHGTHASFNQHKRAGETPCEPCVIGERTYQRLRGRRRRAQAQQVNGQRPLMTSVPLPQLPAAISTRMLTAGTAPDEVFAALNAALRGNYTISYTRAHGLRLHVDPAVADDWIAAAPMADDDQPLIHQLPVRRTA